MVDVAVTEGGKLYLVMEFVEGAALSHLDANFGRVDWALTTLAQIARGLAVIHAKGVVHRDLKPANVLVESIDGQATAKIADFGISTLALEADAMVAPFEDTLEETATPCDGIPDVTLTGTGMMVGTPRYIAPEVARGAAPRPSADIFAFGAIAYEILSGVFPFSDEQVFARLKGGGYVAPPPLARTQPDVDVEIASLVDACLDPRPAARPTARELAGAMSDAAPDSWPPSAPEHEESASARSGAASGRRG
jgi:serine/threonine-protein kinase